MSDPIDFTKIRGNTVEGQRSFFEQLVCHLAKLDGGGGEFRRIEGAGGVEALRPLGGKSDIRPNTILPETRSTGANSISPSQPPSPSIPNSTAM